MSEPLAKRAIDKARSIRRVLSCPERINDGSSGKDAFVSGVFTEPDYTISPADCRLKSGQPDKRCCLETCPKN